MVDYTIANQIRPFQLPDIAGIAGAMQGLELNRMRSQQLQAAEQERNALRGLMADPNFDISSPEASRRILQVAPTIGGPAYNAALSGRRELRQSETAAAEATLKNFELSRESLRGISALPEGDRQAAWEAWRARTEATVPGTRGFIPPAYSDEAFAAMISKADEIAKNLTERPVVTQVPGFPPFLTNPRTGVTRPATEANAPPAAPPAAPRAEGPPMSPGQTAAAPRSQSTDPLLIDAAIRRNEGTARNPASSAVGPYQFIDSTFVDQFRRSFPDVARNLPPEQILTFRGAQTPDGRRVEDVMGPALTTQNQQALVQAGFAPTAGNTYLAHFLGSGGARAVLRADPNTPISQLVSREAIAANPTILGVPGVTAGQIVQWANNTIDMGPRDARRALTTPNAMAAPGATTNAMLAPQDATAMGQPQLPTFAPPRSIAEALYQKNMMDLAVDLEKKRLEAERRRGEQPERVQEAGQTSEAQRRGALTAEQERDERKKQEGRTNVNTTLGKMFAAYERLNEIGGIPSETRGTGGNIAAYAAGTAPGQAVGQALGTRAQSVRNELQSLARTLITDIKNSTGMSAQEMNSNVELQQMLAAVSSPTQSIESVRAIIQNLSERYGLGQTFAPPAPAQAPAAAPATRPAEGVPGPRRGAAAPAGRPTLEQFLERARPANPNASIEDLTAYYNRTYGGR
jgi:hypothetical protein